MKQTDLEMLDRARGNLESEGWDEEAAAVENAINEIERLREALKNAENAAYNAGFHV